MDFQSEYRLIYPLRGVAIGAGGEYGIVELQPGSVLVVYGVSTLAGFVDVVCDGRHYSVFHADVVDRSEAIARLEANVAAAS